MLKTQTNDENTHKFVGYTSTKKFHFALICGFSFYAKNVLNNGLHSAKNMYPLS